eukprot:SAG31_NODE_1905_length_6952_cov_4.685685_7_plen_230_part_00
MRYVALLIVAFLATTLHVASGRAARKKANTDSSPPLSNALGMTEEQCYRRALDATGHDIDEKWFSDVFMVQDIDADNALSDTEFDRVLAIIQRKFDPSPEQTPHRATTHAKDPQVQQSHSASASSEPNVFDKIDLDGNEKLTKEEVAKYFQENGHDGIPAGLWEESDIDKNNAIDWFEFKGPKGGEHPDDANLFSMLDSDKDDEISVEEVRARFYPTFPEMLILIYLFR